MRQGKEREVWIRRREEELLPVPYFHVVFTLPDTLNPLALSKPVQVYNTLFSAAWQTLKVFGADPRQLGARTGMIAILHTWGQTLSLHPHLHCIVPGGGSTAANKWKTARGKGKFLFPVKAMGKVFRAKYMECLQQDLDLDKSLVDDLFRKPWVVFAKRPFANTHSVIEYLGRYTHKIAISNHRIKSVDDKKVTFTYKDYRKGGSQKLMEVEPMEFIRRFSMHILPRAFVRIRHYGILSSTCKKVTIPIVKVQIPVIKINPAVCLSKDYNPRICPCCKTESMVTIQVFAKRGPPRFVVQKPALDTVF